MPRPSIGRGGRAHHVGGRDRRSRAKAGQEAAGLVFGRCGLRLLLHLLGSRPLAFGLLRLFLAVVAQVVFLAG